MHAVGPEIYSLSVNFTQGELRAHVSVGLWRLLVDPTTFTLQVKGHGSSDWASLSGVYKNVQLDAILERGSVEDYLENNVPGFNRKDYESVALEDLYKLITFLNADGWRY